jgi:hypothetical protein
MPRLIAFPTTVGGFALRKLRPTTHQRSLLRTGSRLPGPQRLNLLGLRQKALCKTPSLIGREGNPVRLLSSSISSRRMVVMGRLPSTVSRS